MSESDQTVAVLAQKFSQLENRPIEQVILDGMLSNIEPVSVVEPSGLVAGIDSSDNLLLNIPEHPGAAVAGYSFALVVSEPNGEMRFVQERTAERTDTAHIEPLEIALVYNLPFSEEQKLLRITEYQLRTLIHTPSSRSPYNFEEVLPELRVRLLAARHRETTERKAVRTALFQKSLLDSHLPLKLLLKDGRHSSQNVSTRFTDDVGRKAVERGVRYVGVVKQGTHLWTLLYPYHKAIYRLRQSPYWTLVPPEMILRAYTSEQVEPKTIRLGAQENHCLGGIGGTWVMYGNSSRVFYILEFNVYDLVEYRPLVKKGTPLEYYNRKEYRWHQGTFVAAKNREGAFIGTQTRIAQEDMESLIAPTVNEIHYLAQASFISPGYPITLADAHNRCKITKDRKDQINNRLIIELQRRGFHPVDFETWSADPHKIYER
jgi:hypothetical protein